MQDQEVEIKILKAEEFGGEYDRRSLAYISGLWAVSLWAMVTNNSQALYRMAFTKRQDSFSKILWELGRNIKYSREDIFLK